MDASKLIGYDGAFATRLRALMKNAKATQQDVAAAVGTTRQAISQYADGSVQPNIEKLYKIAEYFNVSADYLLGITDSQSTNIDNKTMCKLLGLSDNVINILKHETSVYCQLGNNNSLYLALENIISKCDKAPLLLSQTINRLVEDGGEEPIIRILGKIFEYKNNPQKSIYVILEGIYEDNDIDFDHSDNAEIVDYLCDDDLFDMLLVRLQHSIIRYKEKYNNIGNKK